MKRTWRATAWWRMAEYIALVACSGLAYFFAFLVVRGLPVAFALIVLTVWAGLRMPTTFVVCHDLAVGVTAVLFTLHGTGTFAAIPGNASRALVAQLFVGMVAVIGLSLALGRDERQALLAQLTEEKEQAQQHGRLLSAIIDSMADGLTVISADKRILLRNAAAARLLGRTGPGDRLAGSSCYGLFRSDGTRVRDDDTVYARQACDSAYLSVD